MGLSSDEIDFIANSIEPVIINRTQSTKSENKNVHDRVERILKALDAIDENEFDFSLFSIGEKKIFLESLIEILELETPVLQRYFISKESKQKSPNRKLLYTLSKKDADLYLDQFISDLFIRNEANHRCILSNGDPSFICNYRYSRKESINYRNEATADIRFRIRNFGDFDNLYHNYMKVYLAEIARHNDQKVNTGLYNPVECIYMIDVYIDIFASLLLQTINYCIMMSDKIDYAEKEKVLENIYLEAKESKIDFKEGSKQEILWSFAIYLFFLTRRNSFATELNVQELLEQQMNDPSYVMEVPEDCKYSYKSIDEVPTKKELRKIFLEGKEEKEERFNKRFAEMQNLIDILLLTAGRDLGSEHLQHAKVVYREVIEDDLQYEISSEKIQTANTIARHINKPETPLYEELSSTIFLREKISRGLFREVGLAALYIKKNKVQKCIYEDILSAFTGYDEIQISKNLKRVYAKYHKILLAEYFDKY